MARQAPNSEVGTEPPPVFFPCPACGKKLKIKAALIGKKVKCPHCQKIVAAPNPPATEPPPATPIWRILLPPFLLALVLWATLALKFNNLDHTALTRWDEVFHAVVAQNVMKHPFRPTLVDAPYLPYDQKKWGENHVWLHKPILPFWQTALSLALFGVNAFALRLPAALLSTGAALFTYLIGKQLFDRRTGLIAATLQAVNPFLMSLIHGYQFADNIDIALLFWVEAGMYFLACALRTGAWRWVLLAGVAQGLAFLCKSYLAGIIFGVALTAWLLPIVRLAKRDDCRIGPLRLLAMLGVTLLTVAPWQVYCMLSFPDEFSYEHGQVWRHLYTNVERWAAPWDRLVFDYLISIHGVFYTPILTAMFVLTGRAIVQRHAGSWLMIAWALGVVLPHLFAVTKTPSATVIAVPACLLLLGFLISSASRGEVLPLAALVGILFLCVVMPPLINRPGWGIPSSPGFGAVMWQRMWVIYHVAAALGFLAFVAMVWLIVRKLLAIDGGAFGRWLGRGAFLLCAGALIWLTYRTVDAAWVVTNADLNDPASVEVGRFVREHFPDNAVLICEQRKGYESTILMFYTDRTCYPLSVRGPDEMAREISQNGGEPYIVTHRNLPLEVVHSCRNRGPSIYRWRPAP